MTQGFDEWLENMGHVEGYQHHYQDAYDAGYEAGAASRHSEVDALSTLNEMSEQKIDDLVLRNIELQKRIDVLTTKVKEMAHIFLDDLEEIQKGEQDV